MQTEYTRAQEMLSFIEKSPTSFHAIQNVKEMLDAVGYQQLKEEEEWKIFPGKGYYVIRSDSS